MVNNNINGKIYHVYNIFVISQISFTRTSYDNAMKPPLQSGQSCKHEHIKHCHHKETIKLLTQHLFNIVWHKLLNNSFLLSNSCPG